MYIHPSIHIPYHHHGAGGSPSNWARGATAARPAAARPPPVGTASRPPRSWTGPPTSSRRTWRTPKTASSWSCTASSRAHRCRRCRGPGTAVMTGAVAAAMAMGGILSARAALALGAPIPTPPTRCVLLLMVVMVVVVVAGCSCSYCLGLGWDYFLGGGGARESLCVIFPLNRLLSLLKKQNTSPDSFT
jgi:hypothetical protein